MTATPLSRRARYAVLAAAFGALLFDGLELGLMPLVSLSVSQSLLGAAYTPTLGGDWFARYTAALMGGAAIGGILLGALGDRIGRTRAMGVSILFYSVFAGVGAWVTTQEQMLVLRFVVGLGVGGVWPNAVALVAESWPDKSRPVVAGLMGAAINSGILLLSQIAQLYPVTPDAWRWLFHLAGAPAVLGVAVLLFLPESPAWLASRAKAGEPKPPAPLRELFRPPLLRMWAKGAILGSLIGAQIAALLGRRLSYFLISVGAFGLTWAMFRLTAPLEATFLPIVFAQGLVATLFFGWLPLYLPELFPTAVRATGAGISYNVGRFATAVGVLAAGALFTALGGSYARVGAAASFIYAAGILVIWLAPETKRQSLAQ